MAPHTGAGSIVQSLCFPPQWSAAPKLRGKLLSPCVVNAAKGQRLAFTVLHCCCPYYTNWWEKNIVKKKKKKKRPRKKCILSRMQREGCIGSLIQPMGYVNKQFALQRDDMTKELWRQNWISFDRMWLPLSLIDFHHRHIAEAFTTWNWEESAAIERKWQSNTNNGGFIKNLFSSLWL